MSNKRDYIIALCVYVVYYVLLEEHGKKIMEVRRFLHAREDRYYTLGVER